ncbi:MAG: hypothetical protein I3J02_00635 [Prevotella sp.]|nr:hypothetical protein [Prevotella sp.]
MEHNTSVLSVAVERLSEISGEGREAICQIRGIRGKKKAARHPTRIEHNTSVPSVAVERLSEIGGKGRETICQIRGNRG